MIDINFCFIYIKSMIIRYFSFLLPFFTVFLIGCAARQTGYGPRFSPVDKHIGKIAIISPDIYVYDVSGGGVPEFRADWSDIAETNLGEALRELLQEKQVEGINIPKMHNLATIDTVTSLVKLIISSIQNHLYGQNPFVTQLDTFNYHTGPLSELCHNLQVDAVMFTFGSDENFSLMRKNILKRATTAKNVNAAISAILTGTIKTYSVPRERTFLCCLVADSEGKIIWYKQYKESDGADLRTTSDADKISRRVLYGLNFRKQ